MDVVEIKLDQIVGVHGCWWSIVVTSSNRVAQPQNAPQPFYTHSKSSTRQGQ